MAAHGARSRARRIDKHGIELDSLAKHGIKGREHLIELTCIARDGANALDARLMQAREIEIALAVVQVERGMLALVTGALGLAQHHVGLGTASGANLQTTPGARRGGRNKLSIQVRSHCRRALEHTRSNGNLSIDRSMTTREDRCHELRDIRIGLGRKCVLVQGKRRGCQIAGKVERTFGRVERRHNASAQPARQAHQTRKAHQAALGLIHIGSRGKVLNVIRNLMQHGIGKASGRLSAAAHQLNTLAYGNATRRMQVEHLEGRDAKRHTNARCDLFGLIKKLVKQLIQNALRGGNAQRQTSGKSGIALVNGLGGSAGGQHVARVHATAIGLHQHVERELARGGQLAHDKTPQLSSAPCRPAAQAEAAIARLPSGLTSSSSTAPSERPR